MRIIYPKEAGGVSIIIPAPGIPTEDCIKDVPKDTAYRIVHDEDVPTDRTFRDAWEMRDEKIAVNMERAVDIQKDRLRQERQPMLEALDVAYMKALETGDLEAQADIVAQKQALRDCTDSPLLTAARTPEELKAVTVEATINKARIRPLP